MELSKDWKIVQIGEVALNEKGAFVNGPFGSDLLTSELVSQGVPVIYIRDIREGIYKRVSTVFVTSEKAKELKFCQVEPGDVLVTKVGDPPGIAAVYPKGMPTGVITQDVIKIRVNSKLVIPEYLIHFLNSQKGFEARKPIIVETTRARFGLTQFKETYIPLPPIAEQKRIAAIAQKCDRLRRTRRYTQQLSDSYLRSVFLEMFGDPATNPMNWDRCEIRDVCESIIDCVNKTASVVEEVTPYKMIRTSNVRDGQINLSNVKYVTKDIYQKWTRRAIPRKGDVILTREAPLGEVGIICFNDTVFLGQRLVQYRVDSKKLNPWFLLHSLQTTNVQQQLRKLGAGSTVEHVAVPDCEQLLIDLPPLPLQEKFAQVVQRFERLRIQQREADRQTEHLFQTVLHRAFRGEL